MPDEQEGVPNTKNSADAVGGNANPPLQPPVEGNEDNASDNGQNGIHRVAQNQNEPQHWTRFVEAACAVLLVLITGNYTYYASKQASAAITAANAANTSAGTADATLKEIQKNERSSSDQFRTQLRKLDDTINQAKRLADASEKANANILEADRPWFGAILSEQSAFEVGKIPSATVVFNNSGKRPAKVTISEVSDYWFSEFPKNPPYHDIGIRSAQIVVPGSAVISKLNLAKDASDPRGA